MKWKDAEEEFENYWKKFGKSATVFRFHDSFDAMGVTKSKTVRTTAQPSDFLVTHDGHTFFAEVKSSTNPSSFSLSNIRDAQWRQAMLTTAAKGLYLFYIRNETNRVWYKVPASFFLSLHKDGIKSVKWEALTEYMFNLNKEFNV